jgi:pimeloyl-ACP methyl ester carboxylesterase
MSDEAILTHKVWGTGTGDPILLLNGGMMTFQAWQPVAAGLESEFRLIGFDFRGMLLSPGAPPSTLDGHVADVVALLDHLQIGRVHAVGTSFGALVAILLAAHHPERVRSLAAITGTERVTEDVWQAAQSLREAARAAAAGGDGGVLFDLLGCIHGGSGRDHGTPPPAVRGDALRLVRGAGRTARVPARP